MDGLPFGKCESEGLKPKNLDPLEYAKKTIDKELLEKRLSSDDAEVEKQYWGKFSFKAIDIFLKTLIIFVYTDRFQVVNE